MRKAPQPEDRQLKKIIIRGNLTFSRDNCDGGSEVVTGPIGNDIELVVNDVR